MRDLYVQIDKILNDVDFSKIWPGFFKCDFALYDKNKVYFKNEIIAYDRRFLGNTSIEYNGDYIAIWNVENPYEADCQMLASNLTHEMFHAFQMKNGEKRYPNDLIMLDYPYNTENHLVKYSENLILANAVLTDDINEKKNLLEKFISARLYRAGLIGEAIKQEYYTETIEGMAEYAGCMALRQISPVKYNEAINKYVDKLRVLDSSFFNIRTMSYYTGALFYILLSETGMNFYHSIGSTDIPFFCVASENSKPMKPSITYDEYLLFTEADKFFCDKKTRFEDFFKVHDEKIQGNFMICGYDPMNITKLGDMILCSHFVKLKNIENDESIFIQGPAVVNMEKGSHNKAHSYIR